MPTLTLLLIILASLLALWSVVAAFLSWRWAAATSYLALWPLYYLPEFSIPESKLVFWGISTLMALGINYMLPFNVAASRTGMAYIAGGALCGTMTGLALSSMAAVICGAAVGCFCGAMAYSRTPRGRGMDFPSRRFFNYVVAKGLPLVVVLSTVAIVAMALYQYFIFQ